MIIVDCSALMTVFSQEEDYPVIDKVLCSEPSKFMSAAALVHCGYMVDAKFGPEANRVMVDLIDAWKILILPFSYEQAMIANAGVLGHPNLSLCASFTYGLAIEKCAPVLYCGDVFDLTDIVPYEY